MPDEPKKVSRGVGFIDMRLHRKLAVTSVLFSGEVEVDAKTMGDDVVGVLLVLRNRTEHAYAEVERDEQN